MPEEMELIARDETGVLRDKITNARVIILSTSGYRAMADALFDHFKSGAGLILYRMGEGYARKLLSSFGEFKMTNEELMEGFSRLAYLAGWGRVNVRLLEQAEAECVVERCAFVLRRNDVGPASCYFFSGILAVAGAQLLKKDLVSRETMCETGGSNVCKFRIYEEPPKKTKP